MRKIFACLYTSCLASIQQVRHAWSHFMLNHQEESISQQYILVSLLAHTVVYTSIIIISLPYFRVSNWLKCRVMPAGITLEWYLPGLVLPYPPDNKNVIKGLLGQYQQILPSRCYCPSLARAITPSGNIYRYCPSQLLITLNSYFQQTFIHAGLVWSHLDPFGCNFKFV